LYLNDPLGGGTTSFPRIGVTLRPELGKLVCWCNVDENMSVNDLTEHQGDDVTEGKKWLANFWFGTAVGPLCSRVAPVVEGRSSSPALPTGAALWPLWLLVALMVLFGAAFALKGYRRGR
jgi:hypothetical protein